MPAPYQPNRGKQNRGNYQENRGNGYRPQGQGGPSARDDTPLDHIPSPYYFVPLADQVWHPEDRVSHDIPFSDGISGVLEFEVENTRPLYVRGTVEKPAKDLSIFAPGGNASPLQREAFHRWVEPYRLGEGGPFAIPGTSLRGMVRNVLKIATFGSMRQADDVKLSVRDMNLPSYREEMTTTLASRGYKQGDYAPKVRSGWLKERKSGEWVLVACEVARVEQRVIEAARKLAVSLNQRQTIGDKYMKIGGDAPLPVSFDSAGSSSLHDHSCGRLEYDKVTSLSRPGDGHQGSLVVTGQPGRSKHMEFVFHSPSREELLADLDAHQHLPIDDSVRRDFVSTHRDGTKDVESWDFWKKRLKRGEWIPVFYLEDSGQVWALGLSQMFRLPGLRSIHHGLPEAHREKRHDLADQLLGSVDEPGLAGRVSFDSAVISIDSPGLHEDILWRVLGSPRPSYCPNYLAQKQAQGKPGRLGGDSYATYLSSEIRLKGWKRYAVRVDGIDEKTPSNLYGKCNIPVVKGRSSYKSATAFKPFKPGCRFKGKLRFHNLRPHELGALVWVLTWGGNGLLRHSLGMAKGLGFGTSVIRIEDASKITFEDFSHVNHTLAGCMEAFVTKMGEAIENWTGRDELKELLALANPANAKKAEGLLGYPSLVMGCDNDFTKAKLSRLILPDYGARVGIKAGNAPFSTVVPPLTSRAHDLQSPLSQPMPAIPLKPAGRPPLRNGVVIDGELIEINGRLKFLPDGYPEREAGKLQGLPDDAKPGSRWKAKAHNIAASGNIFKNPVAL